MAPARAFMLRLVSLAALLAAAIVPARAQATSYQPNLTESQGAAIADGNGRILWSKNGDAQLPMASITKVMTAIVALDSGYPMDSIVVAQPLDLPWYSQIAEIYAGDEVSFEDLLLVTLVFSANDAASQVAIAVAGSEEAFVERMNAKAAELGLKNTHFANPHGLEDEGHYASAEDLVRLGKYALDNYPFIAETVVLPYVDIEINGYEYRFSTTDELLERYPGVRGIKTGSVFAGVSFLGSYKDEGAELYTCVLCCESSEGRWADTIELMDWARGRYRYLEAGKADWVVSVRSFCDNPAWDVVVSLENDARVAMWPGDGPASYTTTLPSHGMLLAPGQKMGEYRWTQGAFVSHSTPYAGRTALARVPAFTPFVLPLMVDTARIGRAA